MDPSDFYTGIVADAYGALKSGHFDWRIYRAFIRDHGEPALELGCGDGDPLLDLRRDGIDVEGIDSSADMLRRLEAMAAIEGLDVVVHRQKMELLDLPRRFRSIFLAGATFTLLVDDATAAETLVRIRRHLAPGGAAFVPLFIPEPTLPERIGLVRESITADGTVLRVATMDERRDERARIQVSTLRYEVVAQGVSSIVEREWVLHWHTQDGFRDMAAAAGLRTIAVLGPDGLPAAADGDDFDFVLAASD